MLRARVTSILNFPLKGGRNKNGFSLIEVLVVLVIIGVVVAAVTFSIHVKNNGQAVRSAANIVRSRLLYAEQQAVIQSATLGVAFTQDGYQFYRLVDNTDQAQFTWQVITHQQALNFQPWPHEVKLSLTLPNEPNALIPNQLPKAPMIVFAASGTITPFTLMIGHYKIVGKYSGEVTISES
jgi:general secretion pathway protein H